MKEQGFIGLPFMPDLRAVAKYNNDALKRVFKGRIKGWFLQAGMPRGVKCIV